MKFNGLGFPVLLVGVPVTADGVPDINYNRLSDAVFDALIRKPARMTGAEVKFVRHHLNMKQADFAAWLHVERSSVAKWEGKDLKPTGMEVSTEILVRLKMAQRIKSDLDVQFPMIEPAIHRRETGPIEITL